MKIAILIFSFVLFSSMQSCSQVKMIEYTFDRAINKEIQSYINGQLEKDPARNFYFYLTRSVSAEKCNNYQLFIASYVGAPLDFISEIINNSTRFYSYQERKIPICFDYDFKFIGYGSENGIIKRKSFTGTLYFIEFSATGRVLRTGT